MQRLLLCSVVMAATAIARPDAQTPAATPAQSRPATPTTPAQTRPATPTPPAQPRPATPAPQTAPTPAPRRPATVTTARGGLAIVVTDMNGAPLRDVRIQVFGPTDRSGTTDGSGQLRITGLQAGTYRLRFLGDDVVEFEKEVAVRGGPNTDVDVSLRPAPPPVIVKEIAPAPPPPAAAPVGPLGELQAVSVPTLIDKAFLSGPRNEVLLACSADTRTTLVQMIVEQPERLYESADVTYYVLGGEGALRLGGRDLPLKQDSFVSIPRGRGFSLQHRGNRNRPLVMVMQLSGEPCEQAK